MTQYKHMRVKPINGAMGAEVFDIDLSGSLSDEALSEIRSAWTEYLVLIFRDQNLTDQQQYDFSRQLRPDHPAPLT